MLTQLFNNTLAWYVWPFILAIPPLIVVLYFLKLRRQPLEVPSTYLWSRTIEDLHVNSLWQRLRSSLLLLLQLLLLLLAMLALLRPGWQGRELVGDRFIFLIDTSASMSATDTDSTRLDESKQRVAELIDAMKSGDVAMIISFSDAARVEQSFTDNHSVLKSALADIKPTQRRSDLSEALRAAAGLANPGASGKASDNDLFVADPLPAELYLFTDGGFAAVPDFFLGNLNPTYDPIGTLVPNNVAVTAFTTSRNQEDPDQIQAFARIENFSGEEREVDVELFRDQTLIDAQRVAIPAGGEGGAEFNLPALTATTLRIVVNADDDLALDNTAYAAINTPQKAQVLLVTPRNDALQIALSTEEVSKIAEVEVVGTSILSAADAKPADLTKEQTDHEALAAAGFYDLIIYDQCTPRVMPQSNTLFFGFLPPMETWEAASEAGQPQIIDVEKAHPILQFVSLDNVRIAEGFAVKGPQGARTLIDADLGPIAQIAPREGFEDLVFGFEILGINDDGDLYANTDWTIRLSFPLFMKNALEYLGGVRSTGDTLSAQPGETITIRTETPVDKIVVHLPDKSRQTLLPESNKSFMFSAAEQLGVYEVYADGELNQRFTVNLFDSRESDLAPRETLELGTAEVTGESSYQPARKEWWKWILAGALVVLMVEWYIYNKRVYL